MPSQNTFHTLEDAVYIPLPRMGTKLRAVVVLADFWTRGSKEGRRGRTGLNFLGAFVRASVSLLLLLYPIRKMQSAGWVDGFVSTGGRDLFWFIFLVKDYYRHCQHPF